LNKRYTEKPFFLSPIMIKTMNIVRMIIAKSVRSSLTANMTLSALDVDAAEKRDGLLEVS
jgi:hypothetical protein